MNPTETTAPVSTTAVPTTISGVWPGAFKIYQTSKAVIKPNVWSLIGIYVLFFVVSIVINFVSGSIKGLAGFLVDLLLSLAIVGLQYSTFTSLFLRSSNGEKVSIDDIFKQAAPYALKMLGLIVLQGILAAMSLLLLIVPFFIVYPRLYLAPYFLIDKNMGIVDALKASWNQSKGHVGKIYGIYGVELLICLLFITIIGIPFAIYFLLMYSAAHVVLYRFIADQPH